jgi:hypothetical protein
VLPNRSMSQATRSRNTASIRGRGKSWARSAVFHHRGRAAADGRWEKAYVEGRTPDNERPINRVDGSRNSCPLPLPLARLHLRRIC